MVTRQCLAAFKLFMRYMANNVKIAKSPGQVRALPAHVVSNDAQAMGKELLKACYFEKFKRSSDKLVTRLDMGNGIALLDQHDYAM